MLEQSRKHMDAIYAFLATFIIGLPLVFINSRVAFTKPADPTWHEISILLKISYLFVFFICTYLLIVFFKAWKAGAQLYRRWLSYFLIYFGIMLVFFVILYPGHWVGDEFNILQSVKIFEPFAWQHYFTNIFYTYCLFTIPTGPAIVFFQITIISIIVGYLSARIRGLSTSKYAPLVVMLVFLLPPVVINNFYPLRLTLYSYLSVLLLFELLRLHRKKYVVRSPNTYIVFISFIIMLLSFWRTEGIVYIFFLPYIGYRLKLLKISGIRPLQMLSIFISCSILFVGFFITKVTSSSRYEITAFANPLSQMLQHPLSGSKTADKLAIIDKVISINMLKDHASENEIPAFWLPGGVRESTYAEYLPAAKKAFIYIALHNPRLFMEAKVKTFVSANGWTPTQPLTEGLLDLNTYAIPKDQTTVDTFHKSNIASGTISKPLKRFVTRVLLFQRNSRMHWLGYPFWSILLPMIILCGLTVYRLHKRDFFIASLSVILLIIAALIFLSAPANYFMYYLPMYLNAYFMLIIAIFTKSGELLHDK